MIGNEFGNKQFSEQSCSSTILRTSDKSWFNWKPSSRSANHGYLTSHARDMATIALPWIQCCDESIDHREQVIEIRIRAWIVLKARATAIVHRTVLFGRIVHDGNCFAEEHSIRQTSHIIDENDDSRISNVWIASSKEPEVTYLDD